MIFPIPRFNFPRDGNSNLDGAKLQIERWGFNLISKKEELKRVGLRSYVTADKGEGQAVQDLVRSVWITADERILVLESKSRDSVTV